MKLNEIGHRLRWTLAVGVMGATACLLNLPTDVSNDDPIASILPEHYSVVTYIGDTVVLDPGVSTVKGHRAGGFDSRWETSDSRVGKLTSGPILISTVANKMSIAAVGPGETQITMTPMTTAFVDGKVLHFVAQMTVLASKPTILDLPSNITLRVGEARTLMANPQGDSPGIVTTGTMLWQTTPGVGPAGVFLVGPGDGLGVNPVPVTSAVEVRGLTPGQTTVTATYEGKGGVKIEKKILVTVTSGTTLTIVSDPRGPADDPAKSRQNLDVGDNRSYQVIDPATGAITTDATWLSTNVNVASLDQTGRADCVAGGTTTIRATAKTSTLTASTTLTCVTPTLVVAPRALALQVGGPPQSVTSTLTSILPTSVTWSTSSSSISIIADRNEVLSVTGLAATAPGKPVYVVATATIGRFTVKDSAAVTVTSVALPTITVSPRTVTLQIGQVQTVASAVTNATGPINVTWSATNANVEVIPNVGSASVKGLTSTGTIPFLLIATYAQGTISVSDTARITVLPATTAGVVASITLEPAVKSLAVGATQRYVVHYFDATLKEIAAEAGSETAYSVDDSPVAGIDNTGLLTARGVGTTRVQAFYRVSGKPTLIGNAQLTVTSTAGSRVAAIYIEPRDAEITAPAVLQYRAILFDAQGNVVTPDAGGEIRFSSNNSGAATIDATGKATGKAAGSEQTTQITAGYYLNNQQLKTDVTPLIVYPPTAGHAGSVEISTANDTRVVKVGQDVFFQVIVRDVNGNQVTTGEAPVVTSSSPTALSVSRDTGTPGGFFYRMHGLAATPLPGVQIKADMTGAAATIGLVVVP